MITGLSKQTPISRHENIYARQDRTESGTKRLRTKRRYISSEHYPVLRIRDDDPNFSHPGSDFFHPASEFFYPASEFYHPGFESKNLSILPKRLFLRSPIRILIFYPSRFPDPGVKKALDPGSAALHLTLGLVCLRGGGRRAAVRPPPSSSSPQSDSDSE